MTMHLGNVSALLSFILVRDASFLFVVSAGLAKEVISFIDATVTSITIYR